MVIKSQNSGFTLIEIIVVFGILALIGGLTSDLFASVLKGANKANTVNEIKQNGNYALDYIERTVRNSTSVVDYDSSRLVVSDEDGECVKFKIVGRDQVLKINGRIDVYNAPFCVYDTDGVFDDGSTFTGAGQTLTNNSSVTGVSLVSGSFDVSEVSGNPTTVTVTFTLSQGEAANSRNDYTASEMFQSFISLRTY